MQPDQMLEIVRKASGASEMYRVTTFKAYRRNKRDELKEITVEVRDAGPGIDGRYHVRAIDEDGKHTRGNPDSNLDVAITFVHWYDFD